MNNLVTVSYKGVVKSFRYAQVTPEKIASEFQIHTSSFSFFNRTRNRFLVFSYHCGTLVGDIHENDLIEIFVIPPTNEVSYDDDAENNYVINVEDDISVNNFNVEDEEIDLVFPKIHLLHDIETHNLKKNSEYCYSSAILSQNLESHVKWYGYDPSGTWIYGIFFMGNHGKYADSEFFEIVKYCPITNDCKLLKRFFGNFRNVVGFDENSGTFMILRNPTPKAKIVLFNDTTNVENEYNLTADNEYEHYVYPNSTIYAVRGNNWVSVNTVVYNTVQINNVTFLDDVVQLSPETILNDFPSKIQTAVINGVDVLLILCYDSVYQYVVGERCLIRYPMIFDIAGNTTITFGFGFWRCNIVGSQDIFVVSNADGYFKLDFVGRQWLPINIVCNYQDMNSDNYSSLRISGFGGCEFTLIRNPRTGRLNGMSTKVSATKYNLQYAPFEPPPVHLGMGSRYHDLYKKHVHLCCFVEPLSLEQLSMEIFYRNPSRDLDLPPNLVRKYMT